MNLTRTILTAAVAIATVGAASLTTASDADARGGKGFGNHRGHSGIHFRHAGHRWGHRHVHFRYGGYARYNPCWKYTRVGLINVCKIVPY